MYLKGWEILDTNCGWVTVSVHRFKYRVALVFHCEFFTDKQAMIIGGCPKKGINMVGYFIIYTLASMIDPCMS